MAHLHKARSHRRLALALQRNAIRTIRATRENTPTPQTADCVYDLSILIGDEEEASKNDKFLDDAILAYGDIRRFDGPGEPPLWDAPCGRARWVKAQRLQKPGKDAEGGVLLQQAALQARCILTALDDSKKQVFFTP